MGYQQVKTPRFYINVLEWLNFSGQQAYMPEVYRTLPINPRSANEFGNLSEGNYYAGNVNTYDLLTSSSFIAFLGSKHTIVGGYDGTRGQFTPAVRIAFNDSLLQLIGLSLASNIINMNPNYSDTFDGFSIGTFDGSIVEKFEIYAGYPDAMLGSCVVGTYYDMPHSPDLNLTMTREYGGTKTLETKGGSTLSNTNWNKPSNWGNLPAWGLQKPALYDEEVDSEDLLSLSASGRRVWNLSFSYLSKEDVFPENSNLSAYGANYYIEEETADRHRSFMQSSGNSNFFAEVVHKTGGGALPFIFNPSGENNPDDFAICRFDQNSFSFKEQAPHLYSISLKIKEIW